MYVDVACTCAHGLWVLVYKTDSSVVHVYAVHSFVLSKDLCNTICSVHVSVMF